MARLTAGTTFPHLRRLHIKVTEVPPEYTNKELLLHALKLGRHRNGRR